MKNQEALAVAKEKFGSAAFVADPERQQRTVGIMVNGVPEVLGTGPTVEEAQAFAESHVNARIQAKLLYGSYGEARLHDGRCEVGMMLYGEFVVLGRAATFIEAFARANRTAAAIHAAEIKEVVEAVLTRFGPVVKVVVGESGHCFIKRGAETLGCGNSFKLALSRAIEKYDQSHRSPRNFRPRGITQKQIEARSMVHVCEPLELNHPA